MEEIREKLMGTQRAGIIKTTRDTVITTEEIGENLKAVCLDDFNSITYLTDPHVPNHEKIVGVLLYTDDYTSEDDLGPLVSLDTKNPSLSIVWGENTKLAIDLIGALMYAFEGALSDLDDDPENKVSTKQEN